jgi:hypothetical protein
LLYWYKSTNTEAEGGLLDARNKPTARALTYTHDACAEYVKGFQRESVLTLKPKFKEAYKGDSGVVREVEACDGRGGRGDSDSKGAEEEEKEEEESDLSLSSEEQTEDDDPEEVILFSPVRLSTGTDRNCNGCSPKSLPAAPAAASAAAAAHQLPAVADIDLATNADRSDDQGQEENVQPLATRPSIPTSTSISGGPSHDMTGELTGPALPPPNRSPAAAAACSVSNAPQELKTLVDRQKWKMLYEEEKLSEQEFRARVVLIKSEGEREELAWSQASGSKQRAKHAAAEIGLLACLTSQPPPNSSPAAAAASSPTNSPTELQILVDRRKWKMQYEYEKLGEQEFRARVLLTNSEGVEEQWAWSQASGSKPKAKHAAAEIGLSRLSCL